MENFMLATVYVGIAVAEGEAARLRVIAQREEIRRALRLDGFPVPGDRIGPKRAPPRPLAARLLGRGR